MDSEFPMNVPAPARGPTKEPASPVEQAPAKEQVAEPDVPVDQKAGRAIEAATASPSAAPLRYTGDGALAECPCCGSLDVGGAIDTAHCYVCKLTITKPRPLQNAIDAWNRRTNRAALPAADAARPDLVERLSYHARERNDMTIDELLQVLSKDGYRNVPQRSHRELELQLLALLAGAPAADAAQPQQVLTTGQILAADRRSDMTDDEALRFGRAIESMTLRHVQPQQVVPEGCRTAPAVATQEMLDAGRAALSSGSTSLAKVYRVMLAAAPPAQQQASRQPGPWFVLGDDKIDSARHVDVILKNGCTLENQAYQAVDWTVVADWRYSAPAPQQAEAPFQQRVQPWLMACFGEMIAGDREERNHRFLEEALELVQACGCSAHEAHQLVDYVYGRDIGEPRQEVGGVMVTLAALCLANDMDMHTCSEVELARIWTKVEQIRAKQAAKPKHSPLPMAQQAEALTDSDGVPYFIHFDDADRTPELVIGKARALVRYEQISASWNAHLYVKIDSNSHDCKYPNAQPDAAEVPQALSGIGQSLHEQDIADRLQGAMNAAPDRDSAEVSKVTLRAAIRALKGGAA